MRDNEIKICKKCKKKFEYSKNSDIPEDIEYCADCRGDRYSKAASKIAKALESMLK